MEILLISRVKVANFTKNSSKTVCFKVAEQIHSKSTIQFKLNLLIQNYRNILTKNRIFVKSLLIKNQTNTYT